MVVALVFVFLAVGLIVSYSSVERIPWVDKLRRLHAGAARRAEWMAPDDVVRRVQQHYLESIDWLAESALFDRVPSAVAQYLSGIYLMRYQHVVGHTTRFIGVLHADHQVEVRHFSDDGRVCLVVDQQRHRRMITYDRLSDTWLETQYLGDSTPVYRMVYDSFHKRWKIDAFIQELPSGWSAHQTSRRVRLLSTLPTSIGRDN
jgi:hypothetical protein